MKRFLKIVALVAVFNLTVKNVEAAKIYSAKTLVTGVELEVSSSSIIGEGVEIEYNLKKDMVLLKIKNRSEDLLTVDWNRAKYIGLDGKEVRAYDFKQKDRGWFESLTATGIRPGDSYEGYVVPSSNLGSISGKGVTGGVIYINKQLFDKESKEMKEKKRDYAELIIPIISGNPYSGRSEDIVIYLGENETTKIEVSEKKPLKQEEKVEVLKKVEVKSGVNKADLAKVEEENRKLQEEIKAKEQLIIFLQEQEALKKQLAEKEAQIQKLIQGN